MRSLCFGVILLALCSCFVAAIDLDGCLRGPLIIETKQKNNLLREEMEKDLGFSMGGKGTIAGVLVISKNRNDSVYAGFKGRKKERSAVAFEFHVDDGTGSLRQISFEQFFQYLTCQQVL